MSDQCPNCGLPGCEDMDSSCAQRIRRDRDTLREQVAHLRAQNESYALDIKMLHEQANSASVMLRMARDDRDASHRNHAADIKANNEENAGLRADVERLTKEVEHADSEADRFASKCIRLQDDNARHLAAIGTLRAFARQVRDLWDHDEDAHRYGTSCRCCDAEAALDATADYAKKADEVKACTRDRCAYGEPCPNCGPFTDGGAR